MAGRLCLHHSNGAGGEHYADPGSFQILRYISRAGGLTLRSATGMMRVCWRGGERSGHLPIAVGRSRRTRPLRQIKNISAVRMN
jgi:hypothetical protein